MPGERGVPGWVAAFDEERQRAGDRLVRVRLGASLALVVVCAVTGYGFDLAGARAQIPVTAAFLVASLALAAAARAWDWVRRRSQFAIVLVDAPIVAAATQLVLPDATNPALFAGGSIAWFLLVCILAQQALDPTILVLAAVFGAIGQAALVVRVGMAPVVPLVVVQVALAAVLLAYFPARMRALVRRVADEEARRDRLGRYFPPSVIAQLVDAQDGRVATVETEVTALFCDISGYTAMSATMRPTEVVELLNAYFPAVVEVVFRHGGTLEKYIGDALLAVWGAPFQSEDDADRAVTAALEMVAAIERLNSEGRLPRPISVHIGLCTGPVAAANLGTDQYLQYATIGDTTNVSSRICGLAGEGQVVIADSTQARLRRPFRLVALPPQAVKGKDAPLVLYRVDGVGP